MYGHVRMSSGPAYFPYIYDLHSVIGYSSLFDSGNGSGLLSKFLKEDTEVLQKLKRYFLKQYRKFSFTKK